MIERIIVMSAAVMILKKIDQKSMENLGKELINEGISKSKVLN